VSAPTRRLAAGIGRHLQRSAAARSVDAAAGFAAARAGPAFSASTNPSSLDLYQTLLAPL
jgi:hypothetical protein